MKQIEITTRVQCSLKEAISLLQKQGFKLIRKSRVEDEYLTQHTLDKYSITELLSTCVLLRYLNVNEKEEFKKITHKKKTYDHETVLSEEKINVNCDDLEKVKQLFLALGFHSLVTVAYDVWVFSDDKREFAFQEVEGLGLLLEYENVHDFQGKEKDDILKAKKEMLEEIKSLGIPITNEIDVKKAYELVKKGSVIDDASNEITE